MTVPEQQLPTEAEQWQRYARQKATYDSALEVWKRAGRLGPPPPRPVPPHIPGPVEPVKIAQRPNGCWAACISSITGIALEEFPDVPDAAREEAWWDENGTRLRNEITAVLRRHGWRKESTWTDTPKGWAMAYGTSPRGYQHAVVVFDGQLWHDPHPSGAGLLSVDQYEILVPIIGKASGPLTYLPKAGS